MAPKLHRALLKKIESSIWKFQKNRDKKSWCRYLWDLLLYKKSIRNSLYFSNSKNDKSAKISNFETVHCSLDLDLSICHFWWAQNIMSFGLRFYTLVDPIIVNIKIFSPIFWNFQISFFNFSKKWAQFDVSAIKYHIYFHTVVYETWV
jgi:hypothetical protein